MKKHFSIIFLLFVFSVSAVFSQTIQQMENQLKTASGQKKVILLSKLSSAYLKKNLKKSIYYGEQGIKSAKKVNASKKTKAQIYNTLGSAYYFQKNYKESVKNYENELEIIEKGSNYRKIGRSYFNVAIIYEKLKKYKSSESNFKKSLLYAKRIKDVKLEANIYKALSENNEKQNDTDEALKNLKNYFKIKDKKFKNKTEILLTELEQNKSEIQNLADITKSKEKKIDSLNLEKEMIEQIAEKDREIFANKEKIHKIETAKQKYRFSILIIVVLFLLIIVWFVIINIIQKRKANKLLITKNSEIKQQKEEIETQNNILNEHKSRIEESHKHITESITYAKRIQKALIRGEDILEENFSQHLIFFKPKDIVSGDFFWVKKISNFVAVVAADCTGHGVPGAFMSMLGISLLNQIVTSRRLDSPGEILDALRNKIKTYLHQKGEYMESKDGMDMSFLLIDIDTLEAKYAGANNSIYVIRDKKLIEYKPTRNPIGVHYKEVNFETQVLKLKKDDSIYLFSDGYADQFGGKDYTKFKIKRFKQLLTDSAKVKMTEQKENLEKTLNNWKGDTEQIDDILVMGIKI